MCRINHLTLGRYKPGHIVIFIAGAIYHGVGKWEPKGKASDELITPGRIGHVFFSPKSALSKLARRRPGWRNYTFSGLWPSSGHPGLYTLMPEGS
jgi:hypothetical protein